MIRRVAEYRGLARELRALIDTLPSLEAPVVTLRYGLDDGGEGRTTRVVAEHLGLPRGRMRRLEKEALAKLRTPEGQEPLLARAV